MSPPDPSSPGSTAPLASDDATAGQQALAVLHLLWRRKWLIAALTLLVTGAAVAVSMSSAERYEATAKLLLTQQEPASIIESYRAEDPERQVNNTKELLQLETVADRVREELGLEQPAEDLLEQVAITSEPNSDVVSVVVEDEDPRQAAAIANALVAEFVEFRRSSAQASYREAAKLARAELATLTARERRSALGRELRTSLNQIETSAALLTGGVEPVRAASVPTEPSAPRPKLAGAVGLLLGLMFAVMVALALEFLDRRLKGEDDFERAFGVPLLATIPRPQKRSRAVLPVEDAGQQEGYATLATNFRFSTLRDELGTVMVTSPGPGEGKTSATLGLARALSVLGQRVVVIEADLRRPSMARYLELPPSGGLTAVLAGLADLRDELVTIDAGTLRPAAAGASPEALRFSILPAGRVPPNPARMLATPVMSAVLARARVLADVVLIDTAPAGAVSDALALVTAVDATIVVGRFRQTTRDAARRTMRIIGKLDTDVLGVVATDWPQRTAGYYGPEEYLPMRENEGEPKARSMARS